MASYVNATQNKQIFVSYLCTECGKANVDVSTIEGKGSARVKLINDTSREDASLAAKNSAFKKYIALTKKMESKKYGGLTCTGECAECGSTQPWATGKYRNSVMKSFIPLLVIIFVIILFTGSTSIFAAGIFTILLGGLLALVLPYIVELICNAISANGTAQIIKNGKENCFPKIINKETEE